MTPLSDEAIEELVRGLDPVDWVQVRLTARLSPVDRVLAGMFAGFAYGVTRVTFDVDILVDLQDEDCEALSARFPLPRY